MRIFAIGLSAAAVLAIAGAAYAAHHEGHPKPDADGDGVVTRAEMQTHATAMFARLDANSDGKLDQADRDMRRQAMRDEMFSRLDADGNGAISRDEFMAFEGHGKSHRGMHGQAMGEPGADGPGKHHRWGKGGHHGGMMKMMMKSADTDGDGAVTKAEFIAAAEKRFTGIDADGDGKATEAERDAHRKEMHGKWRGGHDS